MSRITNTEAVRLASYDDPVAPVEIFDAGGKLVRIVPAHEFRGTSMAGAPGARSHAPSRIPSRRRANGE